MLRRVAFFALLAMPAIAQIIPSVRGVVASDEPLAGNRLAQFYEKTGHRDEAVKELRAFLPQSSDQDRATVERWLSKLAAK